MGSRHRTEGINQRRGQEKRMRCVAVRGQDGMWSAVVMGVLLVL